MSDMSRRGRVYLGVVLASACILGVGAGATALFIDSLAQQFDQQTTKIVDAFPEEALRPAPPIVVPTATPTAEPPSVPLAAQNILLLGSDTRASVDSVDSVDGRSDTMMVVNIPADRGHVTVMSIMRDSWVDIPGHGEAKINAAMAWGGVPLTVQTVEALVGVRIDHVVIVDFAGFGSITDALGGVTVENTIGFEVAGHHYPEGVVRLDGSTALNYVRERYSFPDSDYQRVRNQQSFLKGVLAELMSTSVLNLGKAQALISAASPYLAVDPGFDSGYVARLAFELRDLPAENVRFFTAPTTGTSTSPDGQSIVELDYSRLEQIRLAFMADQLYSLPPETFQY